jgi:hypothetical protein
MDTITITHDGRTVALAGRERFWLAAHIQALPDGHPRRRHVCFMAVYARDVLTGDMPGPYTDSDADHFARLVTNVRGCDRVSALASAPSGHGRSATRRRRRLGPASVSPLPGRRAQSRRCR